MAATIAASPAWGLRGRDFTTDLDVTSEELIRVLDLAAQMKRTPTKFVKSLQGRYLSLLFEKPSLRTRLTFELAIKQLGGDAVTVIGPIGDREPLKDVARNLERWTNGIVARTFRQETIDQLAHWAKIPVVNALSDLYHPCQALADFQTLQERFGDLRGRTLAFVGDGNNVAHSLMLDAARLGMNFSLATPQGYEADASVLSRATQLASETGAVISASNDAFAAVSGADAVYTDVWTSMGQEQEAAARRDAFAPYRVTAELMKAAAGDAIFMHCLPAKRDEEVTDEVIESSQSAVFDQAENRLHAQKALLLTLLR